MARSFSLQTFISELMDMDASTKEQIICYLNAQFEGNSRLVYELMNTKPSFKQLSILLHAFDYMVDYEVHFAINNIPDLGTSLRARLPVSEWNEIKHYFIQWRLSVPEDDLVSRDHPFWNELD